MRSRRIVGLLTGLLVLSTLAGPPAGAVTDDSDAALNRIGKLLLPIDQNVALDVARSTALGPLRPMGAAPRILVVSSGVDTEILPLLARTRVEYPSDDKEGYGTFVASQILQLAPTASIVSVNAWSRGYFDPVTVRYALQWANTNAATVDAVLLAFPPSLLIDPISGSMASGAFERIFDALGHNPLSGPNGMLFGLPYLPLQELDRLVAPLPYYERAAVWELRWAWERWLWPWWEISKLKEKDVAVVMPAGDTGPGPQSILGLANLADVVTVGAFDGTTVATSSAAGPGMDGSVKPDLLAPTGVMGLVPNDSRLAGALRSRGLLLPTTVNPDWPFGAPEASADRARIDSTFSAAATVTAALAGMEQEGLKDVETRRGALTAGAQPLPGVPAWRQGAGVLRSAPDAAYATGRPVALAHATLGMEPESGEWSVTVPFAGGAPAGGTAIAPDHIGTTPLGRSDVRTLPDAGAPKPAVTPAGNALKVAATLTGDGTEPGAYCGYVSVSFPGVGGDEVPLCLFDGFRMFTGRALYVHDIPAEDVTFSLAPALPPGASLLDHPLHMLPINPIDVQLEHAVTSNTVTCPTATGPQTGCGHAQFRTVLPGYYKVRLHADYGMPFRTAGGPEEVGGNPAYQSFKTLLLPPAPGCAEEYKPRGDWSDLYRGCTQTFLTGAAPGAPVEYEKPTASFAVGPVIAGERLRVNLGFLRKLIGTAVVGRYIDVINPCRDLEYLEFDAGNGFRPNTLPGASNDVERRLWRFGCADAAVDALPGASFSSALGRYAFRLPTPNYSAHMALDFSYEIQNALIVVAVVVGSDWHLAVITPEGIERLASSNGSKDVGLDSFTRIGSSKGDAHFDFRFLPRGVSEGTLYFVFVPPNGLGLSRATITGLSTELDTWTNADWPATDFTRNEMGCTPGSQCGHTFSFNPQITYDAPADSQPYAGQYRGRDLCVTRASGKTCEDWSMMVHTPADTTSAVGAHLMDVVDLGGAREGVIGSGDVSVWSDLVSTGASIASPGRPPVNGSQVLEFVESLAYADWASVVQARLWLHAQRFRTNGKFWDVLTFPAGFFERRTGDFRVCIADGPMPPEGPASRCTFGEPQAQPLLPVTVSRPDLAVYAPAG